MDRTRVQRKAARRSWESTSASPHVRQIAPEDRMHDVAGARETAAVGRRKRPWAQNLSGDRALEPMVISPIGEHESACVDQLKIKRSGVQPEFYGRIFRKSAVCSRVYRALQPLAGQRPRIFQAIAFYKGRTDPFDPSTFAS
jgi:hypothetical protein